MIYELIDPSVEYLGPATPSTCEETVMMIERAARTCYRSEPKGDAEGFVRKVLARGHSSVAEHAWVQLVTEQGYQLLGLERTSVMTTMVNLRRALEVRCPQDDKFFSRTPFSELMGLGPMQGEYVTPTLDVPHTFRITCSRACMFQFATYRTMSRLAESQRYVNYEKKGLRIIRPQDGCIDDVYYQHMADAYERGLESGRKPEDARGVLCNDVATTMIITGFWDHFLAQRLDPHAQGEIRWVAQKIKGMLAEAKND